MIRLFRNKQPQRALVEKLLHNVHWSPKSPVPGRISVSPTIPMSHESEKDLKGENVVITGGTNGLGRALAMKLSRLKATVVLWDSNKAALDETANIMKVVGGRIHSYHCDLTRKEEIYRVAEKTKREVGQITMVINNADATSEKLLLDTPDNLIQRAFDVNVLSHFWTTKAFLPNMIDANKGHIVTIASMAGHMGIHKLTDYCATKAAAVSFLLALKTELEREGSKGVKTTVVCPYFMKSATSEKAPDLRFVSALNPDNVADRTIEAIQAQESVVFMPGWFKYALLPKWITPPAISSLLLRLLIKDPSPGPASVPSAAAPVKIVQFINTPAPAAATSQLPPLSQRSEVEIKNAATIAKINLQEKREEKKL